MRRLQVGVVALVLLCALAAGCTPPAADKPAAPAATADGTFDARLPGDGERALPQLSPDHKHILGVRDGILTLARLSDGLVVASYPTEPGQLLRGFAWSPDSNAFAYHTETERPLPTSSKWIKLVSHVFLAHPDGTTESVCTLGPPIMGPRQLLWSPCGRYLWWDKPFTLYELQPGEAHVRADVDNEYNCIRSPLFSHDGSKLAFTLSCASGGENLWVMDTNTRDIHQITHQDDGDYPYRWIDGDTLLAQVGAIGTGGGFVHGIASVDLRSGSRTLVDNPPVAGDPGSPRLLAMHVVKGVSPQGNYIIGESRDPAGAGSKVYLLDLSSGERTFILSGQAAQQGYGIWSALWISEERLLLSVRRESYSGDDFGSKGCFQIVEYIKGSDLVGLVQSDTALAVLAADGDRLYYLQSDESGEHWAVRCSILD